MIMKAYWLAIYLPLPEPFFLILVSQIQGLTHAVDKHCTLSCMPSSSSWDFSLHLCFHIKHTMVLWCLEHREGIKYLLFCCLCCPQTPWISMTTLCHFSYNLNLWFFITVNLPNKTQFSKRNSHTWVHFRNIEGSSKSLDSTLWRPHKGSSR